MKARVLDYVEYPPGEHWRIFKMPDPSWADIEAAIRRLDRHQFPSLILWPSADETTHELSGDYDAFEVMGGAGVWWLAGTFNGYYQRRLDFPGKGEQEVQLWTSDQGFADAERHVCRDLEAILRAVRYYAEFGEFDPSLPWER